MSLRNAFLILTRKFYTVAALAFYYVICIAIVLLAGYGVLAPTFKHFIDLDLGNRSIDILYGIFGGSNFFDVLDLVLVIVDDIINVLYNSIGAMVGVWLFLIIVIGFLARFLFGLVELTTCALLNTHMSISASFSYFHMFVRNLGKNALFQLQKIVISLPLDLVIWLILWQIFGMSHNENTKLLSVFLLILVFVVLFSLRFAITSAWAPVIVTGDAKGFKAMPLAIKTSAKNFQRTWGAHLVLLMFVVFLNIFVGLFTCMVGWIITVPSSAFLFNILNMTVYYANTNKRYYIDKETVFTPPLQ